MSFSSSLRKRERHLPVVGLLAVLTICRYRRQEKWTVALNISVFWFSIRREHCFHCSPVTRANKRKFVIFYPHPQRSPRMRSSSASQSPPSTVKLTRFGDDRWTDVESAGLNIQGFLREAKSFLQLATCQHCHVERDLAKLKTIPLFYVTELNNE